MRIFIALFFATLWIAACNGSKTMTNELPDSVTVEVTLADTSKILDSLRLFGWNSIQAEKMYTQAVKQTDKGQVCVFEIKKLPVGTYFIGTDLRDMKPLFLGTEKKVSLKGLALPFNTFEVKNSTLNKDYNTLVKRMQNFNQRFMTMQTDYNESKGKPEVLAKVKEQMATQDKEKMALLDSLKNANSPLARIMAFGAFQSYQNNKEENQTEGAYLAANFFKQVDFKDSVYARMPLYYENVKNYASVLTQVGLSADKQAEALDTLFTKVGKESPLHRATLVACMFGMMSKNNGLFVKYAKVYMEDYKGEYAMLDKFVTQQLQALKGPAGIGEEAAEIKGKTPAGSTLALSDLRGKYVLIDFWASWCGPCRRENPNVVRLYNKYKDKGFDILGVSLDNNKAKWEAAIEKDRLTWHHISDLKGWASELSKPYGVRGIPYTVLVDKEGKIIGTRLRGAALEAKLRSLFGE